MYAINEKLVELEKKGTPIKVALIGVGQMGREIVATVGQMQGMRISVAVDFDHERAEKGFASSSRKCTIARTNDVEKASQAIREGKSVSATDYRVATRTPDVDVVIDATGSPEMGAIISLDAIHNKKHIVMMNVECDITVGPILRRMAADAGVIYTLAAGDEPAAIVELYRFADALGFEIVCAGKGKNNPLNIYANPDTEKAKADARKMSAKMLCEFVDGSKTAIEMAAVSNATGLVPDVRGMHGAKSTVPELNKVFIPKKDGGVLNGSGVVDFAIGVHPGVYLVVKSDNELLRDGLSQRDMGMGPYYTLFRPFHLCSVEVPLTAAQSVIYGESSGHPGKKLVSECVAAAKKDLKAGERLDGIGEYCYRGIIEKVEVAKKEKLIPLGLANGCVLKRDVKCDEVISFDMVECIPDSTLWKLRQLQDALTD